MADLDILRDLTAHGVDTCRIVGNDSVLAPALIEGICDGVVSGVATALPEVILELYGQNQQTGSAEFRRASRLLDEFIAQLEPFPTPWGLKWIVEARGILHRNIGEPGRDQTCACDDEENRSRKQLLRNVTIPVWFHALMNGSGPQCN